MLRQADTAIFSADHLPATVIGSCGKEPGAVVTMRIVVKTAPLRQWEVEREMRARVKASLDTAGISPAA